MMTITAVSVGTRGDVNPLAELGQEMRERGHEFRICTHEAFRPLVEKKGLTFFKLDMDAEHVMQYLVTEYKSSMDFMRGMFKLKKENPAFMEQTLNAIEGKKMCNVEEIQEALIDLVSGKYDECARAVGEKIGKEKGIKVAADAIEQIGEQNGVSV